MTEETTQETQEYQAPKHEPSPLVKTQGALTRTQYEMVVQLAEAKDVGISELHRTIVGEWLSANWAREFALYSSTKT
jgi:hypothetical protein